jgi:hypothetical protein
MEISMQLSLTFEQPIHNLILPLLPLTAVERFIGHAHELFLYQDRGIKRTAGFFQY